MLADLNTLKIFLRVPDSGQDALLTQLLRDADRAIKRRAKRDLETGNYTHYFNGNGQPALPLRQRPVQQSGLAVYLDPAGYYGQAAGAFGAAPLVFGRDYALKSDQDDGSSKSGLLIRLGGGPTGAPFGWPWAQDQAKGSLTASRAPYWPTGYGNIKVTYTAGLGVGAPLTFDGTGTILTGTLPSNTTLPLDLTVLCCKVAAWLRQNTPVGTPVTLDKPGDPVIGNLAAGKSPDASPMIGTIDEVLGSYREVTL